MERCLACEAVVSRATGYARPSIVYALCRTDYDEI